MAGLSSHVANGSLYYPSASSMLLLIVFAEAENALRTLFKRCVECPKQTPICPSCTGNQLCALVPSSCHRCSYMTCIDNPSPTPPSSGPNVGALAGGVVGGVALVALAVFFVWRFSIKKRREQQDRELEEEWANDDVANKKRRSEANGHLSGAGSTRSRGSLATSILSRASNIIQIAYIPGVTNRSGTNSIVNANPVPPIPAAFRSGQNTPKSPLSNEGDALFFRPGDLRDSTWSDTGTLQTNRNRDTQYTMQSITPSLARSSVASSVVYFDDATAAPMPANAAQRRAPRVVSIRTAATTPSENSPTSTSPKRTPQVIVPGQGAGASRGASSLVKATQITVGGSHKSRQGTTTTSRHAPGVPSPLSGANNPIESHDDDENARQSLLSDDGRSTPQPAGSPFIDATERPNSIGNTSPVRPNPYASMGSAIRRSTDAPLRRGKSIGGLSAVMEESSKRLSKAPSEEGLTANIDHASNRGSTDSPFSDIHATE